MSGERLSSYPGAAALPARLPAEVPCRALILLRYCWRGSAPHGLTSRALILREGKGWRGWAVPGSCTTWPASSGGMASSNWPVPISRAPGRATHAVLMSASAGPASASPLTDHKPSGQPEPSAWTALLPANQMQLNLHMASSRFARVSLAADAVRRVPTFAVCSGKCESQMPRHVSSQFGSGRGSGYLTTQSMCGAWSRVRR
ncbi:hypothetical protein SVAN01_07540 [Stagonosporopsis vannaccii]|nr:hypothetical protein SVAN01_07540 [Stagonosporopsis vannaccii]